VQATTESASHLYSWCLALSEARGICLESRHLAKVLRHMMQFVICISQV